MLVVFGGAPDGGADAAGHDERHLIDDELIVVEGRHTGGPAIDRGSLDLEVGDPERCQVGEVLVDRGDGPLGRFEAGADRGGEPHQISGAAEKAVIHWHSLVKDHG